MPIPEASGPVGAGLRDGRPFELSFLLHLDSDIPPATAYRDAIRLFVAAEELGYDCGWVVHRHFRQGNEHVSGPLVLLAAVAEHTQRIGLGTGVFVLPLVSPLAVAEDAALLDELSGGRVQLGVGSGPFPMAWEAFGKDIARRHQLFGDSVAQLHRVLEGEPVNSAGETLHPPAPGLRGRLWQATTSNPERAIAEARAAALAGDGLQLSRAKLQGQTAQDQATLIAAYRAASPTDRGTARVQASRAVYPHPDRSHAVRAVTPGVKRWQAWQPADRRSRHLSPEDYLRQDQTLLGPSELIAEGLSADPALTGITDLLVSFVPGVPEYAEHIRLLAATAQDVAPLLGWRPATASRPQHSGGVPETQTRPKPP